MYCVSKSYLQIWGCHFTVTGLQTSYYIKYRLEDMNLGPVYDKILKRSLQTEIDITRVIIKYKSTVEEFKI